MAGAGKHRWVLETTPNVHIAPYEAVFAFRPEATAKRFRGGEPVLKLAGTHKLNISDPPSVLAVAKAKPNLRNAVKQMCIELKPASEIKAFIKSETEGTSATAAGRIIADKINVRSDAKVLWPPNDVVFVGVTLPSQTPGHLRSVGLIEVHTAMQGAVIVALDPSTVRVGDPVVLGVPGFSQSHVLGYVAGAKSGRTVVVTLSKHVANLE